MLTKWYNTWTTWFSLLMTCYTCSVDCYWWHCYSGSPLKWCYCYSEESDVCCYSVVLVLWKWKCEYSVDCCTFWRWWCHCVEIILFCVILLPVDLVGWWVIVTFVLVHSLLIFDAIFLDIWLMSLYDYSVESILVTCIVEVIWLLQGVKWYLCSVLFLYCVSHSVVTIFMWNYSVPLPLTCWEAIWPLLFILIHFLHLHYANYRVSCGVLFVPIPGAFLGGGRRLLEWSYSDAIWCSAVVVVGGGDGGRRSDRPRAVLGDWHRGVPCLYGWWQAGILPWHSTFSYRVYSFSYSVMQICLFVCLVTDDILTLFSLLWVVSIVVVCDDMTDSNYSLCVVLTFPWLCDYSVVTDDSIQSDKCKSDVWLSLLKWPLFSGTLMRMTGLTIPYSQLCMVWDVVWLLAWSQWPTVLFWPSLPSFIRSSNDVAWPIVLLEALSCLSLLWLTDINGMWLSIIQWYSILELQVVIFIVAYLSRNKLTDLLCWWNMLCLR